ncbi:PREDICTED: uncharacterized protein LOC105449138 [Wasmannia auropunctata]|uniref:uncharacterized protein LOC105449138 n=1 Tax=Wasmannia auropunctata TaxID=64793 RepID=UPI0005EFC6F6|nr:PREDICTED: uncharacterized protein LOC105449138 [Wasmannia auropunctata]
MTHTKVLSFMIVVIEKEDNIMKKINVQFPSICCCRGNSVWHTDSFYTFINKNLWRHHTNVRQFATFSTSSRLFDKSRGFLVEERSYHTNHGHDCGGLGQIEKSARKKYNDQKGAKCTHNYYVFILHHGSSMLFCYHFTMLWNIYERHDQHY